ncbi:secretogranin-1 [Hyperolius riggenbachi]|uniref:secretogranin-1 n=1 Tax=Hyperolius riggenbachi TaxID=752182 RepID=UPI0035A32F77
MLPGLLLLTLLVGILEVNAVPFDKGGRQEELVTRCIVEVLSNALAKPNAPPIDLECREILKKSSRHTQDDRDDEVKHYETRTIKDLPNLDKHQHNSKEETEQSLDNEENEEKRHHAESESREEEEEEDKVKETEHPDDNEESTGHSKERSFAEDEKNEDDEERGPHKDHTEKEGIEKRNKYHHSDSHEAKHDIIDKKAYHTEKNAEDFHGKDDEEETRNLEEIIKRHPLSKDWKELLYRPDKHHSHEKPGENEEEEEQQEEKRSYKPNHEELRQRLFGNDEKRNHLDELRNHIASDENTLHSRGQKPRYSLENHLQKNDFDKRFHHEKESSEESREKRHHHQGSEEWTEHHDSSEESNEKEMNAHYEDKRQHELIKKWPGPKNSRINYVQSKEDSEENEEDIDKRHEHENLEKEDFFRKLKHHLQGSDEDEPFKPEKKQEEKRHYIGEEMVDEMKRYYPEFPPEKDLRQYDEDKFHRNSEEAKFPYELYQPIHSEEKRAYFNKHRHPSDPLRWRSRYFENVDNIEEDRKRSVQVKNIFPDYGDYDLWGKRQFLDDMNREYGEKIRPSKNQKLEEKRQYDRMDELAQLLNYKKKSVEFPDFYDSEEIKKRHYDERGRYNQRPLTEDEEKELENLAIMDLELQKIAEKLSNNRQG